MTLWKVLLLCPHATIKATETCRNTSAVAEKNKIEGPFMWYGSHFVTDIKNDLNLVADNPESCPKSNLYTNWQTRYAFDHRHKFSDNSFKDICSMTCMRWCNKYGTRWVEERKTRRALEKGVRVKIIRWSDVVILLKGRPSADRWLHSPTGHMRLTKTLLYAAQYTVQCKLSARYTSPDSKRPSSLGPVVQWLMILPSS